MNTNLKATQTVTIQSTAANVWNVLTHPELIKQYLFGTEVTTGWKEGSAIMFEG